MNLGAAEILVICVVALLVFGPQRLPEIARQVGGAMRELRRMQDSVKTELKQVLDDETPIVSSAAAKPAARTPVPEPDAEPDHTDVPPPPSAAQSDATTDNGAPETTAPQTSAPQTSAPQTSAPQAGASLANDDGFPDPSGSFS